EPVAIGHSDLGMAVLATAPKPDTTSSDAVKRALLAAKSIVYTDPESGGIAGGRFARLREGLGIGDEIHKKSRVGTGERHTTYGARGQADIAVQLSSEIHAVAGVQFVPMPAEFRASVTFSAALASTQPNPTRPRPSFTSSLPPVPLR